MKLTNLLATNAVGKSTRMTNFVNALGEDFKEMSYSFQKKTRDNPEGEEVTFKNFGRYYPEKKYFVLGKKDKQGKWISLDLSDLNNWRSKLDFYSKVINKELEYDIEHVFQEGYFNNTSMQGSPNALKQIGIKSADFIFFIYDNVEQFRARCEGRTGKEKTLEWAENSTGWKDNKSYSVTHDKYKLEEDENFVIEKHTIDAPVDLLVQKYL